MPNGTVATLPRIAIVRTPAARVRERTHRSPAAFAMEAALAATIFSAGMLVCLAALLFVVLAAPLVAVGVLWVLWRCDDSETARRSRRVRARIRRRARALGLRVLAP